MKKRGPKPQSKVKIKWSANFAYAIGLMVTDGNLSSDGRHLCFVSKDKELVELFQDGLGIQDGYIKKEKGHYENSGFYYRYQFGDVIFYKFLLSIGLSPNKSKTIGDINIPDEYFVDFLRGHFDGDGCTYSYWDTRWKSSFMYYLSFASASEKHILWLRQEINNNFNVGGHISKSKTKTYYQLRFAKKESLVIFRVMYKNKNGLFLKRKKLKIDKTLAIVEEVLEV